MAPEFWEHVEKGPECWEWTGAATHDGYGRFKVNGQETMAAKHLYEKERGPLAEGSRLYHECGNPGCVRPSHMSPRSPEELTRISGGPCGTNSRKTRCRHGHPLKGKNLYVDPEGKRKCRACTRRVRDERKEKFSGPRRPRPAPSTLARKMRTMTFVELGAYYGVSDTTVRKWARKAGLW